MDTFRGARQPNEAKVCARLREKLGCRGMAMCADALITARSTQRCSIDARNTAGDAACRYTPKIIQRKEPPAAGIWRAKAAAAIACAIGGADRSKQRRIKAARQVLPIGPHSKRRQVWPGHLHVFANQPAMAINARHPLRTTQAQDVGCHPRLQRDGGLTIDGLAGIGVNRQRRIAKVYHQPASAGGDGGNRGQIERRCCCAARAGRCASWRAG